MFNILLIKIDNNKFGKRYTIATAPTEAEALRKSQYYSKLYQSKGLYHILYKPTHIVTYEKAV